MSLPMNGFCLLSVHCFAAPFLGPRAFLFIPPVLGLVTAATTIAWRTRRSQALLKTWAAKNGFQIIRQEYRAMRRGPFQWTSRGQTVYFVTVRDKDGLERSGWVRCGAWFTGLWSEAVDVSWVDLSNVSLDDATFLQTLPSRWVWLFILFVVALAALLLLLIPKPPVPQI